jgi:GntR family transcriptional regulator
MPPVDRSPVPPSRRVEADLRRRIEAGEWATGQALPSVGALAAEYRVARNTVAKALRKLEADGLIQIVPSWGTFRQ